MQAQFIKSFLNVPLSLPIHPRFATTKRGSIAAGATLVTAAAARIKTAGHLANLIAASKHYGGWSKVRPKESPAQQEPGGQHVRKKAH